MTSTEKTTEIRQIYKTVVLGRDTTLQSGFLSEASGEQISYQLYHFLRVGIGVCRVKHDCGHTIFQMWSLPDGEKLNDITRSFLHGHSAAVLVVRPSDIEDIQELISIGKEKRKVTVIAVIGTVQNAEMIAASIDEKHEEVLKVESADSVRDVMEKVSDLLLSTNYDEHKLKVLSVSPSACMPFEPTISTSKTPPNTQEEITKIKELCKSFDLETTKDKCIIEIDEGILSISLVNGSVRFQPNLCHFCEMDCSRSVHICIVGVDTGWSSEGLGDRALLTMAKIYALYIRELPSHVEKQLHFASRCNNFTLRKELRDDEETAKALHDLGYRPITSKIDLLEAAMRRVREGRMSASLYTFLQGTLQKIRERTDS
ncbi:MAG: hypothetical protein BAJATHORv1_60126 [Candidatus Thorarchaeota archaeon]|nr:MAG: hypothetical protein BAJATHORv1_60126 [Candidatus Thorarchaeota archaeon]